jgi:hypothetical protein
MCYVLQAAPISPDIFTKQSSLPSAICKFIYEKLVVFQSMIDNT